MPWYKLRRPPLRAAILAVGLVAAGASRAATHAVGPGQPYANIGDVPLESLTAGDTVLIHWRAAPYHEKWVIGGQGTAAAPITFRGVAGPDGERPVIDGENATTRLALNYWSEARGVIKIGGSSVPPDITPTYIVLENLDIRGARPPAIFFDDAGAQQSYVQNSAAIYVERGQHVTVRNCIIRECGNGLFVASSPAEAAREILIEGNYIHSNGNVDRIYEHNTYTAAIGITYQYNRFGPLVAGAGGNNLKDRSAGLVVRGNWIEGGNRQLDLVDAEDSPLIRDDPAYGETFVYGNVLIEPAGAGNRQIVHYGGDSGAESWYRKGTLYFHDNTLVSTRTDRTTLLRLSTNDEACVAVNNILFATHAGYNFALLDNTGMLTVSHNWAKPGWVQAFGGDDGTLLDDATWITGSAPGFADLAAQDFLLRYDGAAVDAAGALPPQLPPEHVPERQYWKHQDGVERHVRGAAADLGALERLPFDFDADADADVDDFTVLAEALGGPALPPGGSAPAAATRATFDGDDDGDLDVIDAAAFQAAAGRLRAFLE
jgi:hypothetical protein